MDNDEYPLEYFCRLCASEGVIVHSLFPPGDEDPKDELVRMIDVLTSVTLTRTQDSGAVICDKCLQMLDLFCQFREECLRQDVMIRTRRELEKERQEEEERRLAAEQQQQLAAAAAAAAAAAIQAAAQQIVPIEPDVLIKEEEDPPTIVIDDCKDEPDDEEEDDDDEDGEEPQSADSSLVVAANGSSFQSPAEISLYSQTNSLSISVQVNQISLGGSSPGLIGVPSVPSATTPPANNAAAESRPSRVAFRKGKLDPNKPPPDCEVCQESFATHYDFEQHMDSVHAWDRGTRCSLACDPCQMRFTKSYNLKRHMYEVHGELAPGLTVTACEFCGLKFLRGYTLNRHIAKVHSKHRKAKKMMIIKSK